MDSDPNNWYQSPNLGMIPAAITSFSQPIPFSPLQMLPPFTQPSYPSVQYHSPLQTITKFLQPYHYPPPQPNHSTTIINGYPFLNVSPHPHTNARMFRSPLHVAPLPFNATSQRPSIPSSQQAYSNSNFWFHSSVSQRTSDKPSISQLQFTDLKTTISDSFKPRIKQATRNLIPITGRVQKLQRSKPRCKPRTVSLISQKSKSDSPVVLNGAINGVPLTDTPKRGPELVCLYSDPSTFKVHRVLEQTTDVKFTLDVDRKQVEESNDDDIIRKPFGKILILDLHVVASGSSSEYNTVVGMILKFMNHSKKKIPIWLHCHVIKLMYHGRDNSQRYGCNFLGQYNFRKTENCYASSYYEYGDFVVVPTSTVHGDILWKHASILQIEVDEIPGD